MSSGLIKRDSDSSKGSENSEVESLSKLPYRWFEVLLTQHFLHCCLPSITARVGHVPGQVTAEQRNWSADKQRMHSWFPLRQNKPDLARECNIKQQIG